MLSYQHEYHAGNFADVLKHWCLQLCLDSLNRKDAPWTYFDTHAGDGRYLLREGKAAASGEWHGGILRVWEGRQDSPPALRSYLDAVASCNTDGAPSVYPGSPMLAAMALRAQDRAVLCELHPQAFPVLREALAERASVMVHHRDGFEGVQSLLPPPSGRGLVLIDPSYELKADFQRIPQWAAKALRRWRQMTLLVWYPVLGEGLHEAMVAALTSLGGTGAGKGVPWLRVELLRNGAGKPNGAPSLVAAEPTRAPVGTGAKTAFTGLLGCGMLILNPPWQMDQRLAEGLDWLAQTLHCSGRLNSHLL